MVMPACGTFHYAGLVPDTKAALESGQWTLEDQSGAARLKGLSPPRAWGFWKRDSRRDDIFDRLRENRLVGLEPTLRISECHLVLETASRHRAQLCSASLEIDPSLIESLQGGDVLTLLRTDTADIGISLLRRGQLVVAVGAVTATPLGHDVGVRGGRVVNHATAGPGQSLLSDAWVEVSVSDQTLRLREGEATIIGNYKCSVIRCHQEGTPGTYESLAISLEGLCAHEAAVHSAELLARDNAGLIMKKWS
jgi:hypothetical protein